MRGWVEQLGVGPWWGYRNVSLRSQFGGEQAQVRMHVALAYQRGMQIELIQQINNAPSPYRFFHDQPQAQLLHHLGYMVDDTDAAMRGPRWRAARTCDARRRLALRLSRTRSDQRDLHRADAGRSRVDCELRGLCA